MLKKANINWNAKQLAKMVMKGSIVFDNAVQRGYAWDSETGGVKRQSLLIHSLLVGYPVPPLYAVKSESGYDMLDGQQRSRTVADFYEDKFELTDVPEIEFENMDGEIEVIDVNGLKYSDLPEELKDILDSYSFTIYYFEGITDDEIAEMFFRLNNGKPLTAIELTRVKAKSMETIKEIGRHELFESALTAKALAKYTNEDIIVKSYAILNEKDPSFETKSIRPLLQNAEFTEDDEDQLTQIYTRILNVYNLMEDKKRAKRLITRTHLITSVPIIWKSIEDNISEDTMAAWATEFFLPQGRATISAIYNENAGSGCARKEAIKKRLNAMTKHYTEFVKNSNSVEGGDK